jgi:hypothetical protein
VTRGTDHRVDPWQVPEVEALASLRRRPAGRYGLRHVVVLVAVFPLVLWWYRASLPTGLEPSSAWWAALGLAALLGAATLATYVPSRTVDGHRASGASCGAMAGVLVVLAALSLGGAVPTLFSALPAVVLAGAALAARILTGVTCR